MPQQTAVNPIMQLLPIVLIFIVFYFLLIRPQKLKEKEHQKMLGAIDKNDDVVTLGGIHGTIVGVKEKTFLLRIDENVKIEIERNSIAYVKKAQNAGK
ncbi:MAG: preprotein translocase subunit YajC [Candidatus Omnitrophica bacterium]|jgi:preprotein translocase subunit YajC|nr:preprotein translocase subunit YajC [Candidatus Omnitrophota bacterium]